jgi:hypothetical protein
MDGRLAAAACRTIPWKRCSTINPHSAPATPLPLVVAVPPDPLPGLIDSRGVDMSKDHYGELRPVEYPLWFVVSPEGVTVLPDGKHQLPDGFGTLAVDWSGEECVALFSTRNNAREYSLATVGDHALLGPISNINELRELSCRWKVDYVYGFIDPPTPTGGPAEMPWLIRFKDVCPDDPQQ